MGGVGADWNASKLPPVPTAPLCTGGGGGEESEKSRRSTAGATGVAATSPMAGGAADVLEDDFELDFVLSAFELRRLDDWDEFDFLDDLSLSSPSGLSSPVDTGGGNFPS